MKISRRLALAGGAALLMPHIGRAQSGPTLRLGFLSDMSGPFRDLSGPGSLVAAKQAVADFIAAGGNLKVEFVQADHQHKPDVGAAIARQWYDRDGVDVIFEVNNSAIAFAVSDLTRERDKVFLITGASSVDLTGPRCSPNSIHWTYDTWMLSNAVGSAIVRNGGDSWYFITADYAFGHALQRDTSAVVERTGGRVLGAARYPFPSTSDFSTLLVQAQSSRAKVVGLANSGMDMVNCVKQAAEFGLPRQGIKMAGLQCLLGDVHAIGLDAAKGLLITEPFYWNMNDGTRAFTRSIWPRMPQVAPVSAVHAAAYSSVMHYLKAATALGADAAKASGRAQVAQMKAMPVDDICFGPSRIREDGRKIHPAYLFEVKSPEAVKEQWDYYNVVDTIPAEQAFRPISEGGCPLVRG